MVVAAAAGDAGDVLIAGADWDVDGGEAVLILGFLVIYLLFLLALCLSGGLLAWSIARRRDAFVVGSFAFAAAASGLFWQVAADTRTALLLGWIAAALSGLAVKAAASTSMGPFRMRPGIVAVVLLAAAGGLIASTVAEERREPPGPTVAERTRPLATEIGRQLGTTPSHTVNEVAVTAAHAGAVVMQADELGSGGVDLVIRLRAPGGDERQCWRFRLPRRLADPQPEPVDCPSVAVVDGVSSGFAGELGGALGALSPADKLDISKVRAAAQEVVAAWYGPDPGWPGAALETGMLANVTTTLEVERLPTGPVAVAVQVGLTDCVLARLDLVDHTGWVTRTWYPTYAQLLTPSPACAPTLATSDPPP